MIRNKLLLLTALLLVPAIHYAQHTDEINSNRPGESMSAFSVGKSVIQIETGIFGLKEEHNLLKYEAAGFGLDATLRYGLLLENLELIADIQYVNQTYNSPMSTTDRANFKQTSFGAKYLIFDPNKNYKKEPNIYSWKANNKFNWHQLLPAVSVFAGANFIFAKNPYAFSQESSILPKLILITQNHFGGGKWVFVTNIISDYMTTDYPSLSYILTLTHGFNTKWSAFIENQGIKSDFYSDAIVRGGAAYLLTKDLQIDASISTNFKNTPSVLYGGIGLSWRYDAKYKEVRIELDKDSKGSQMDEKMKKKKKKSDKKQKK